MSRDGPPRAKKPKLDDSEVEEVGEDGDNDIFAAIVSSNSVDEVVTAILEQLRAGSEETGLENPVGQDPSISERAQLPSVSDLAEDGEFCDGLDYWFRSGEMPSADQPAAASVATSTEPPSRSELEQLFFDIFTQQIQSTTMDNSSLLGELRRLLPSVARTHVNALIGHMLDWIERQRRNDIQNVPIAPMVESGSNMIQSDPTVHSGGVRAGRGSSTCNLCGGKSNKNCPCKMHDDGSGDVDENPNKRGKYKCKKCGNLLKSCPCKIHVDSSGVVEDFNGKKYSAKLIENVNEKTESSIARSSSIERALEFLRSEALEESRSGKKTDSDSNGSTEGHKCGLCQYLKTRKDHKNNCVLRPGECFRVGEDGEVYKLTEILSEEQSESNKVARAREEESDEDSEEEGDSTKNLRHIMEQDDRKPQAVDKFQGGDEDSDEEGDSTKNLRHIMEQDERNATAVEEKEDCSKEIDEEEDEGKLEVKKGDDTNGGKDGGGDQSGGSNKEPDADGGFEGVERHAV